MSLTSSPSSLLITCLYHLNLASLAFSVMSTTPHVLISSFHNVSEQLSFISSYYVSIPSQPYFPQLLCNCHAMSSSDLFIPYLLFSLSPTAKFCYKETCHVFTTQEMNYNVAEGYCRDIGYNIIKINSKTKNEYVANVIKSLTMSDDWIKSYIGMYSAIPFPPCVPLSILRLHFIQIIQYHVITVFIYVMFNKYKTFSVLIYSYINTNGNCENEKLYGNTTPGGRIVLSHTISSFPMQFPRVLM